ncbi:MAG: hypothetical protein NC420_05835 [Eubacterium sp.]|nr:hypothetical protein [Eubacterium sp.]
MGRSYRKTAVCICALLWGLTACAPQENSAEQSAALGTEVSSTDAGYEEGTTGNAEDSTEDGTDSVGNRIDHSGNGTDHTGDGSGSQQASSIDASISGILASCAGKIITETIETSGGRRITIDAEAAVDGISRVSRYRYIPRAITDDDRKALFEKLFPAENWDVNAAAVYDEKEDAWQFVTPGGQRWIYRVRDAEPFGEQVLDLERIDIKRDYRKETGAYSVQIAGGSIAEEDMPLEEVLFLLEVTGCIPAEIERLGQQSMEPIAGEGVYSCDNIYVCGPGDANTYAKAVFKQTLDGMPVTAWHNAATATASRSVFPVKVWGAFFTAEEIGLDSPILSVEEAVDAMREQIDTAQIQEEQLFVKKITLEYLTVLSLDGDSEIVPVWRFLETERNRGSESILAVNAVNGELIWEQRRVFTE